ncbi:MAG: fumarylacetoacetate hydrolase family protein [Anaerolineaceae bacterium]|jgi:2-keto-4-pentenoate hydratase/2-oxohepta-3-ene-1,7-dioic acid hydratase in catechol pathway|nr:fumarylacetoacetate hydrolase family protein [Anaerolineaceae bacterium]MDD4042053.1 fumarylacetoacetate hydrolase family protein [Anaerolineaceae bacterium]
MRIIRFKDKNDQVQYGWIYQEKVGLIQGDLFGEFRRLEATLLLSELELLLPCQPSKIIAVGRNYAEHAAEMNNELPNYPMIFMKPPSALITNGEPILLPGQSKQVEHEAELAIVVGKIAKNLTQENVNEAIFGYTIANDVTARDLQKLDGQWTRAKGFDTFCPLGPWIDTQFDPSDAMISCHVNHALRQMGSTKDMNFNPKKLMIYISSIMTLMPGDVILTGTPAGVGPLVDGDLVTVHIDGLGTLVNPVRNAN